MAHVVSTSAGFVAAANTLENLDAGTASRRAASACAAASCASAAAAIRTASVAARASPLDSESCTGDFVIKQAHTSTVTRPAQIIKIRRLMVASFPVNGVGLGVAEFSAAIAGTTKR